MKLTTRGAAFLLLMGAMFVLTAMPVLAQEGDQGEAPPTEQTQPGGGMEPAVEVTTPADAEVQLDWTYRYMIPAGIVLGALVILVTSAQYFTSVVRKRYRIVEE